MRLTKMTANRVLDLAVAARHAVTTREKGQVIGECLDRSRIGRMQGEVSYLKNAISRLSSIERRELVALMNLGQGYEPSQWSMLVSNAIPGDAAEYVLSKLGMLERYLSTGIQKAPWE